MRASPGMHGLRCSIPGTIVHRDDLDRSMGLGEERIQTPLDPILRIPRTDREGHERQSITSKESSNRRQRSLTSNVVCWSTTPTPGCP